LLSISIFGSGHAMGSIYIGDCFRKKEIEKLLTPLSTITNDPHLS